MPRERPRILVADSDEESSNFIAELLSLYNYEVIHAPTAADAAHLAASLEFDSLVVSLDMPDGGFTLSQSLREVDGFEDVPVLFSTSEEYDYALLMEAQFYGALFLHMKPFNECELLAQLSTMVRLKILRDEIKGRMNELDRLASTDPLTGLYNRRMFFRRMDEEVARAGRTAAPMCLIYVDIDHFKDINDIHGHAAGDAVLQQVARTMTRIIRRGDVLGRIGGEEFLILLPDTPGSAGQRIAERLRQRVEHATIIYAGQKIKVTISAGVFHAADPVGLSLDEMVKVADQALYEAKESGRNRVVYRGEEENNNSAG
jgi:diguanylate cyclase (GGDEF)-like protein